MTITFPMNRRALLFVALALFILVGDYVMLQMKQFIPLWVLAGVAGDFLIIVPLSYYLMIVRKKQNRSIFSVLPMVLLGALLLSFSMPTAYRSYLLYLSAPIAVIELTASSFAFYKLIQLIQTIKKNKNESIPFSDLLKSSITKTMGDTLPTRLFISEFLIWVYAFFSWRIKNPLRESYPSFTYHRKEYFGVFLMILHTSILESIGVHFLLLSWSPIAAWIHTILGLYGLLFFIGDYNALRHHPFIMKNQELILQVGLRKKICIELRNIESVQNSNQDQYESDRKKKEVFIAGLSLFEKPQFEIILKEPVLATGFLGRAKRVSKVYLSVDEPEKIYSYLH